MVVDNLARKMRRGIQFYSGEEGGEKRRVVENVPKTARGDGDDDGDNG
jgi:hypothetical protein